MYNKGLSEGLSCHVESGEYEGKKYYMVLGARTMEWGRVLILNLGFGGGSI